MKRNTDNDDPTWREISIVWNFQPRSSPLMQELRSVPALIDNTMDRLTGEPRTISEIPVNYEDRIYWYPGSVQLDAWWAWWPLMRGPRRVFLLALFPLMCLILGVRMLLPAIRTRLNRG